jgi:hypothetical protein
LRITSYASLLILPAALPGFLVVGGQIGPIALKKRSHRLTFGFALRERIVSAISLFRASVLDSVTLSTLTLIQCCGTSTIQCFYLDAVFVYKGIIAMQGWTARKT